MNKMLTPIKRYDILEMFAGEGIFYVKNNRVLIGEKKAIALFCEHIESTLLYWMKRSC